MLVEACGHGDDGGGIKFSGDGIGVVVVERTEWIKGVALRMGMIIWHRCSIQGAGKRGIRGEAGSKCEPY